MLFSQSILLVAALAAVNSAAPTANGAVENSKSPYSPAHAIFRSLIVHTGEMKREPGYYYYGKKVDAEDAAAEKRGYYYYGKKVDAEDAAAEKRGYYYYGKKAEAEASTEKREPGYYYYGKKVDVADVANEKRGYYYYGKKVNAEGAEEKRDPGYYYYGKATDAETEEKREADAEAPVE
jgi:hypothetical protein